MSDHGEIIKLTKNLYETEINTPGYLVANAIYTPSYLSFDYALSYYGLIPETVYVYTSATYNKKKKKNYTNALGTFTYRDVPSQVYPYGINIINEGDYSYVIATPEKAICDKLYTLKPVKNKKEMKFLLFNDLRIDNAMFKELNFEDLNILCDIYKSTNMKLLKKVIGDFNENNTSTND
jgi:predicted transcriptional regulator of viral defense system